ncbi:placenta-specific protein 9 isoform X3 [Lithobates pipiens]
MDCVRSGNMYIAPLVLLLLMVLSGSLTAAEPASPFHTDRGDWCTEHRKFHSRLDVVQETLDEDYPNLLPLRSQHFINTAFLLMCTL